MMRAKLAVGGMACFCAIALLTIAFAARAEPGDAKPLLTIADCPTGYQLTVEDNDQLQPLNRSDNISDNKAVLATVPKVIDDETVFTKQQALAPHDFVTGCVLPETTQP